MELLSTPSIAQTKLVRGDTIFWAQPVVYTADTYHVRKTPEVDSLLKQLESGKIPMNLMSSNTYNALTAKDTIDFYASPYITKGNGTFASYPGGEEEFIRFLQSNMRPLGNLKVAAKSDTANIIAQIYINFQIEKDGTVSGVNLTYDPDYATDEELIRVIKLSVWKPAIINGQPVAGGYDMYIRLIKK